MFKRKLCIMAVVLLMALPVIAYAQGVIDLPQTGQTKCYNASGGVIACANTGQDGDWQAGVAWPDPRFTVGSDAEADCVTDNLTGLMWSKNGNLPERTWQGALDYVATINSGGGLCGYTDWRLPNINELESLVHAGYNEENCGGTACSTLAAWLNTQGFSNVQSYLYWSSTTYADNTGNAWVVNMWYGSVGYDGKDYGSYVWPVRTDSVSLWKTGQTGSNATGDDGDLQKGVTWPDPRFIVSGDCVTDDLTGLMWVKSLEVATRTSWQNALDYANGLELCGYTDWRLPNRKELFSLINYGQADTAGWLNTQGFINVQSDWYWSSTTSADATEDAWVVLMWDGRVGYGYKPLDYYVWPVRAGSGICTPPPSGMVSWWRAENNANDSVGTNHGTLQNGATFATGKVGQAFSFDGVDDYIAIPNGIVPATARNFTVDAWVFPNDTASSRYVLYGGTEDNGGEFTLAVDNGQYLFRLKFSDGSSYVVTSPATTSAWAFVTGVRRGTIMELWVDGDLKASTAVPDLNLWTVGSGLNNARIGSYNEWTDQNKEFWKGLIDEVEIFNRALSQAEIQAIYNAGSAGKCQQQYTLTVTKTGEGTGTVTSNPAGINCGTDCTKSYTSGTSVTLTAAADAGSAFAGWSGGTGSASSCSGTGDCTFNITADSGVTATFSLTYSITGKIVNVLGGPLPNISVNLSGLVTTTVITNAQGVYTFTNLLPGSYTITPSSAFHTFTPSSRSVNITNSNITEQNFTAMRSRTITGYTISGSITSGGIGLSGVVVNLTGAGNATVATDANGNYIFRGLSNGNYTVTPSLTGYAFAPTSRDVTINNANITGVNFTATFIGGTGDYSISGRITNVLGGPARGVTVRLTTAVERIAVTNANGEYIFTNLASGNYRVTPSRTGLTFTPAYRDITITNANITGVNFSANRVR